MKHTEDRPATLRMPRSRGVVTGLLLVILGAWGALIPFIGPRFDFAYTPGQVWTAARGWLEVLPGVAAALGGLLLIISGNRAIAMLGGWLAALAGAWFVVGTQFAPLLRIGSVGDPVAVTDRKRAALELAYFSGLGVLIVFLAGAVLSRLAVRLARDVRPVPAAPPADEQVAAADEPAAGASPEPYSDAKYSEALTMPREQKMPAASGEAASTEHRSRFLRRHRAGV
ncbi:hypothetical protein B4U45_25500 [Mycobacterium persicum]|uniref:Secreted protein n=1 Tax=Mycobacterium persicum TaxID=1487726 RepID=A0A8E2LRS0_9MYCO|nr:hypothetical protein [Mycobacterium persicum]KZS82895.1 hypothetical protein A4G31_24365 [Mycobacterium persicum]ORB97378.1 hypothetical protein B1T44_25965 [Mycobacterium persicum]ORC09455.1 hypothetical protein B4U45_25500 [Mycobacterium persicum]VAZ74564.1 hypothetical protein LAUMK15_02349 [Mycobacterium persicum]VAZ92208.1 hypothetical protein LAUMK4_02027 [Mycobacterium persicum]